MHRPICHRDPILVRCPSGGRTGANELQAQVGSSPGPGRVPALLSCKETPRNPPIAKRPGSELTGGRRKITGQAGSPNGRQTLNPPGPSARSGSWSCLVPLIGKLVRYEPPPKRVAGGRDWAFGLDERGGICVRQENMGTSLPSAIRGSSTEGAPPPGLGRVSCWIRIGALIRAEMEKQRAGKNC
jgi:hypothetical protein